MWLHKQLLLVLAKNLDTMNMRYAKLQSSIEVREQLADEGEIKNYTGIDSPYETPVKPELILDTEQLSIDESVKKVMRLLVEKGILNDAKLFT